MCSTPQGARFTEEDFRLYRAVVGFRNVLVHGYLSVDLGVLEDIIRNRRYRVVLRLAGRIAERFDDP